MVAAIQRFKSKQDLARLAPKTCFISAEAVERVVRQIGEQRKAARELGGETGLFDIQAEHLSGLNQSNQARQGSREVVYALFGRVESVSFDPDPASPDSAHQAQDVPGSIRKSVNPANSSIVIRYYGRFERFVNLQHLQVRKSPSPLSGRDGRHCSGSAACHSL